MFPSPFPEYISFFCADLSTPPDFPLLPEEDKFLKTLSSSKRQTEFSHGRSCAHQALAKFKLESEPILRNAETREPGASLIPENTLRRLLVCLMMFPE